MIYGRRASHHLLLSSSGDSFPTASRWTRSFNGGEWKWHLNAIAAHIAGIESLQHLFIQGAGAYGVWREFDSWFAGPSPPLRINDTIPERLEVWARRLRQPGKKHLSRAMSMFIRNNMANRSLKPKHWKGVHLKVNIPSQDVPRRSRPLAMVIKWNPPDDPWIKLNIDGAYIEAKDKAGGGGVIRDHAGNMLTAFATPLDAHSAIEAELLAIHVGLTLAMEFRRPIWVESDAEQAVKLASGVSWGPAHISRVMARLAIHKRQQDIRFTFIHREGNKAGDLLAKMGLESNKYYRMDARTAPRHLKAIIRTEAMGIPHIRVRPEDDE